MSWYLKLGNIVKYSTDTRWQCVPTIDKTGSLLVKKEEEYKVGSGYFEFENQKIMMIKGFAWCIEGGCALWCFQMEYFWRFENKWTNFRKVRITKLFHWQWQSCFWKNFNQRNRYRADFNLVLRLLIYLPFQNIFKDESLLMLGASSLFTGWDISNIRVQLHCVQTNNRLITELKMVS